MPGSRPVQGASIQLRVTGASPRARQAREAYTRDVVRLVNSSTTTEATYYPAIRALLAEALAVTARPGPTDDG